MFSHVPKAEIKGRSTPLLNKVDKEGKIGGSLIVKKKVKNQYQWFSDILWLILFCFLSNAALLGRFLVFSRELHYGEI